ncbi:MAG: energy transducer TonB [Pseudomonadota bacterium]
MEVFVPPEVELKRKPVYPEHKRQQHQEGWVDLNFMIDPAGKPYDITVIASTDRAFERAAVRSLSQWQYTPATLGSTSIDAGAVQRFTFALEGASGARPKFGRRYKKLQKAIDIEDIEAADKAYTSLAETSRNLYEEAYFQVATYLYRKLIGASKAHQYRALSWASSFDRDEQYLPSNVTNSLLAARLLLEVDLKLLAEAQRTAKKILERDTPKAHKDTATKVLVYVEQIRVSAQAFSIRGQLPEGYRGYHRLLKKTFAFSEIDGDIAELRVHCDRGYVGFIYQPDMVYTINPELKACSLIIIGNPGTQYTLTEGA